MRLKTEEWRSGEEMARALAHSSTSLLGEQFVIRRVAPRARRATFADIFPVLVLFLVLVTQLSVRIVIIEKAYTLEQLRFTALEKDTELRQLRLELAYATRPVVMASKAKGELEFAPLSPQRTRMLKN